MIVPSVADDRNLARANDPWLPDSPRGKLLEKHGLPPQPRDTVEPGDTGK